MKKLVLASMMALASLSLVPAPTLRAQADISIKDPAEYNAYSMASTQSDPKAKAAGLESFLTTYPQSVVKSVVLNMLLNTYQQLADTDHVLSTAAKILQVDPNNPEAIYITVFIKKGQCAKTSDVQTCDDAAALAQKGLTIPKPAATSDDDWKKQTAAAYPLYQSAISTDDVYAKKDFKAAVAEYRTELMGLPAEQTQSGMGLVDTLNLAEAYAKLTPPDAVNAVWFYARALAFAPASYKAVIEKKLDYWYNKYHGAMDGLDAIKTQAAATEFPPNTLIISPAATPAEKIHAILANTADLSTLALADKELVLAFGAKDDADKLWAVMKDKDTPVPGTVIEATASQIKMAVTDDAKQAKTPDFIVNMKTPLTDKELATITVGSDLGLSAAGKAELDGTYDSYTQIPGTDTVAQSAQIVLRDGSIVPEKKKTVPVHKPAAGHHPAAH
jgi:hypothetical protein